jgi:hypothetical protein
VSFSRLLKTRQEHLAAKTLLALRCACFVRLFTAEPQRSRAGTNFFFSAALCVSSARSALMVNFNAETAELTQRAAEKTF